MRAGENPLTPVKLEQALEALVVEPVRPVCWACRAPASRGEPKRILVRRNASTPASDRILCASRQPTLSQIGATRRPRLADHP